MPWWCAITQRTICPPPPVRARVQSSASKNPCCPSSPSAASLRRLRIAARGSTASARKLLYGESTSSLSMPGCRASAAQPCAL